MPPMMRLTITEAATTISVYRIVASRVGQVTFFNSSLASLTNDKATCGKPVSRVKGVDLACWDISVVFSRQVYLG